MPEAAGFLDGLPLGYHGLKSLLFEVCHYGTGFILSRYFLEQLVELAGHWGCKLVCDEIMTAGRTSKHFLASQGHGRIWPDYITLGKFHTAGMVLKKQGQVDHFKGVACTW